MTSKVCSCGRVIEMTQRKCAACMQEMRGRTGLLPQGSTWQWRKTRRRKLTRDPLCQEQACGHRATAVHHRVPRAAGGDDSDENLISLCREHHAASDRGERLVLQPSHASPRDGFA